MARDKTRIPQGQSGRDGGLHHHGAGSEKTFYISQVSYLSILFIDINSNKWYFFSSQYLEGTAMLYKPYNNFSINLAKASLIRFYERTRKDGCVVSDLSLGGGPDEILFSPEKIEELKATIEQYNRQGGRYFWLYSNIAINLDVVSSVYAGESYMTVSFPGGEWTSSEDNVPEEGCIKNKYNEYIRFAEQTMQKDFSAAVKRDVVLQRDIPVPQPLNFSKKSAQPEGPS
jgi:hypothetical protein